MVPVQDGPREGEVKRVADALTSTLDDLFSENESLRAQAESYERTATILHNENELLRRELTRNKRQRDHYFQCYTALKAKVASISALAEEAVRMTEVHAYGEALLPTLESNGAGHGREEQSAPSQKRGDYYLARALGGA
jgi:predicted RNase H-like nuclease (RuvC/YqgF family)